MRLTFSFPDDIPISLSCTCYPKISLDACPQRSGSSVVLFPQLLSSNADQLCFGTGTEVQNCRTAGVARPRSSHNDYSMCYKHNNTKLSRLKDQSKSFIFSRGIHFICLFQPVSILLMRMSACSSKHLRWLFPSR